MVKNLTLLLGSGLPAWGGWRLGEGQGMMLAWWLAVCGFSLGWYHARQFVRAYLD